MKSTNNLEIVEKLKSLGLSEREARVYLVLNKFDRLGIKKLSLETGLPAQSLYYYLESLKNKRLVCESEHNGKRSFASEHIQSLKDDFQDKMNIVDLIDGQLVRLKLAGTNNLGIYKGQKNIQRLFIDRMKKGRPGDKFLVLESNMLNFFSDFIMDDAFKLYESVRINRKVVVNVVAVTNRGDKYNEFDLEYDFHRPYSETRVIEKPVVGFSGLYVWKDRVWIMLEMGSGEPELLEINGQKIADNFKFYFLNVWQNAKVIYRSNDW